MSNKLSRKAKMMKKKVAEKKVHKRNNLFIGLLSAIIVVLVIILIVVFLPSGDSSPSATMKLSPNAKNFTLPDTEGNIHSLSDYAGKPILLDFTASWCHWCHVLAPEIKNLYNIYKDEVHFLSINCGEDTKTAKMNKEQDEIPWTFLVDENKEAVYKYGVTGYPYIVLLRPDGTLYTDQSGVNGFYSNFDSAIKELR